MLFGPSSPYDIDIVHSRDPKTSTDAHDTSMPSTPIIVYPASSPIETERQSSIWRGILCRRIWESLDFLCVKQSLLYEDLVPSSTEMEIMTGSASESSTCRNTLSSKSNSTQEKDRAMLPILRPHISREIEPRQ